MSGKRVYCWGATDCGQVGNGPLQDEIPPDCVAYKHKQLKATLILDTGAHATQVAAGFQHTCVATTGVPKCWGQGSDYQLGDELSDGEIGSPYVSYSPVSVVVPAGKTFTKVYVTNMGYSSGAVASDNSAWGFGMFRGAKFEFRIPNGELP